YLRSSAHLKTLKPEVNSVHYMCGAPAHPLAQAKAVSEYVLSINGVIDKYEDPGPGVSDLDYSTDERL
ncbi:MAG: hypothetical protein AAGC91_04125, partial [Pseudomonadota bacterium]